MWKDIKAINGLTPGECINEKTGNDQKNSFSKWPIESVFGVLVDYITNNEKTIDYLVCDDMGTEIADFIAMDTRNNKIIYIHCKYDSKGLSASTFQDVCGQAMKNIRYIINTSQENNKYLKDRSSKWDVKWPEYGKNAVNFVPLGFFHNYPYSPR